jgi:hypothetical protein
MRQADIFVSPSTMADAAIRRPWYLALPVLFRSRVTKYVLFVLLIGYGMVLRAHHLAYRPFWVDEAESSINAMTILQHGVPTGHYLGLPIYENSLTEPWPKNPEFEFRDSSYSKRDLAIYHAWIPLYSIAGAFALGGIHPDTDVTARHVMHSGRDMYRRTLLARLPAVGFGFFFLIFIFFAAREMHSAAAGWAALVAGAIANPAVEAARQARYYSATLTIATLAVWMIWRVYKHGRWRDYILAGAAMGLLFHTHAVTFIILGVASVLLIPLIRRQDKWISKIIVFGSIIGIFVVPWMLYTGFLQQAAVIPKARSLFRGPADVLAYPAREAPFAVAAIIFMICFAGIAIFRRRLPQRITRAFFHARAPILWLFACGLLGYMTFLLEMPAASYFYERMTLAILAPCLLFGACASATIAQIGPRQVAPVTACGLFVAMLVATKRADFVAPIAAEDRADVYSLCGWLRDFHFDPESRLYATPNNHLIMTFYTGMPWADIAPVRKSFLDGYSGHITILEGSTAYLALNPGEIRSVAHEQGQELTDEQVDRISDLIQFRLSERDLAGHVASIRPALSPSPINLEPYFKLQRIRTNWAVQWWIHGIGSPMMFGYQVRAYRDWWPIFFYRFVNPDARRGENLNYRARIKEADAYVIPKLEWVLYDCPARAGASASR